MASEIRSLNGYLFKDESARAANELLEARVEALEKTTSTGGGSTGGGSIAVDETLTQSGAAADAAAVGTRFGAVEGAQTALEGRVTALEGGSIAVDATLTQSGKAADAKAVGDAVQGLQAAHDNLAAQVGAIQPGLTQAEKNALLTLLGGAAYGSAEMKASYDALSALWEGGDAPEVVPVQSVTISQGTLTLTVGDTATLTATVLPASSTDRTVVWSVSPSGFATVAGGVVKAQAAGSCTVTASCGGKSASCAVTVESAIKEVTVDTAIAGTGRVWNTRTPLCQSLFVPLTMKQDFTLKKLDFMINLAKNTNIEVSFYNKTEGKNEGTNVTLAGTEGDYHAVVDFGGVDVLAGNEYQIWLNSTEKDAMCYPYVRDAVIAKNDYFDITGTAYRWNNSVIKYLGYVVLTQDTSANIEVKSVTLSQNALTLRVGGSATLKATVVPSNATDRKVVWSVSPSGYATVTDGKVSATAPGNCVITATAGGKSATCAITVEASGGEQTVTVDTAASTVSSRVWSQSTPLLANYFVPITAKQNFKLKQLDFTVHLSAATNIEMSFYNKTDGKNEGTNVTLAATAGDYRAVVDYGGIDIAAGKEYQIWLNAGSAVMCYPVVTAGSLSENDYFDVTGTEYKYNNDKIKYLGYITIEV